MQPATTSQQALGNLNSYSGQMKQPQDIYNTQSQSLGVPQAQQQVSGLRQAITNTTNLLNQVAPSVYGRTGGSLVTDAQATRQIGNEQAPINQQLNTEGQQYTGANADLTNLLSKVDTLSGLQQQGQQNEYSNLENIYKDLSSSEQAALANQLEQQKLAEQTREFNTNADLAQQAAAKAAAGTGSGGVTIGGGGSGNNNSPSSPVYGGSYGYKTGNNGSGGFYFRAPSGQSISALQYAQQSGSDYKGLVQKMADNGDSGAKAYLQLGLPTSPTPYSPKSWQYNLIKAFTG